MALFVKMALGAEPSTGIASTENREVNPAQVTRFYLVNAFPRLATTLTGTPQDTVVLRQGEFQEEDQSIVTTTPGAQGKLLAWVQRSSLWLEPITAPPSKGGAVLIPLTEMRVVEAAGETTLKPEILSKGKDLSVAVNSDMVLPSATTLVTGEMGSAGILIGGHTSVRVTPHSQVQFIYDATGENPRLLLKIKQGAIFCKVGRLENGRYPDVAVQNSVGAAASIGSSDFYVQSDLVSLHACLVTGKLLFGGVVPLAVGNMDWYMPDLTASAQTGPLIQHWPPQTDAKKRAEQDSQILHQAVDWADQLNVNVHSLGQTGETGLSTDDLKYFAQIPRIFWYVEAQAQPAKGASN